jgi:predicted nucleotide-binding protein (sugar kinase/HSP70/actin superfamily)
LNLQLGKQLAKIGIKAFPMDLVDSDAEDMSDFKRMFWGLGARILRTAKQIARMPNWYGVHLTNFSCGADSFIEHFYRHVLRDKPSLILELDEHSAVAGLLTRVEAYRNVVKNLQEKRVSIILEPEEEDSLEQAG